MAESIEQLSYEMTVAALAEQERALAGLRARAGTVIAAASVAASFLATHASANSVIWTVARGLLFVISVGAAIVVLLPATLVFAYNGALISRRLMLPEMMTLRTHIAPPSRGCSLTWRGTAT